MSATPAKEVTTKQVRTVRFGFYTADEVRRLSVKRIVTPIIFDNLKNPIPDGLYDPALGPMDMFGKCTTCGLVGSHCPGHFGHVELPVPVYNPLIFSTLYRLMRCMCTNCHHFKLRQDQVDAYANKLHVLTQGDLVAGVQARTDKSGTQNKEWREFVGSLAEDDDSPGQPSTSQPQSYVGAYGTSTGHGKKSKGAAIPLKHSSSGPQAQPQLTQHTLDAMQDTVSELLSRMSAQGKCQNCNAVCPAIKKQGGLKLFAAWSSTKALLENARKGISMRSVLDDPRVIAQMEEEAAKAAAHGADDKDSDFEEEEKGKAGVRAKKGSGSDDADADDLIGSEDGMVGMEPEAAAGRGMDGFAAQVEGIDMRPKYLTPSEVREHMRLLWRCEAALLSLLYTARALPGRSGAAAATDATQGYEMFFLTVLPVAPNKFRPISRMGENVFEHVQNVVLAKCITACLELQTLATVDSAAGTDAATAGLSGAGAEAIAAAREADVGRRMSLWLNLQNNVCALIDSTTAENSDAQGIRQQLEKKEGLFRKHMMGKRVNYAARSVISPDPYIGTGEIGVPPYFAKRLSFPERVTPWNVERLRQLVVAGADVHPGALAVEDENGKVVSLATMGKERREALAKQLLSSSASLSRVGALGAVGRLGASAKSAAAASGGNKIVYRHLMDGDVMLTNRQPTLHKPGLMAHRARVLRGERTIRMHYANCATFNADFDGDEINLHLPQDQHGRAEGYNIVHADHQYIVPTDGKPIRGLIQDHVVSGTLLTKRGTFLTKREYTQLVYLGCTPWTRRLHARGAGGGLFSTVTDSASPDIQLEPPCLIKPQELWSGKQVVSTVVRYFTRGLPPLTFTCGSKVPASYWGESSGEEQLEFFRGALVRGCVDKNQFGKFGLVHAVQELYGGGAAGALLSAFSRLFTHYLQNHGFTCGMDDLLLIPSAEAKRDKLLQGAEVRAVAASAELLLMPGQDEAQRVQAVKAYVPSSIQESPKEHVRSLAEANAKVSRELGEKYRANPDTGKAHDMKGSGAMHGLSSEVVKVCLPSGQVKPFPRNCLSAMTITGAKGSLVNFSQISCLLGQQELEGRRPPRMASGKTLPCFRPYDSGARANGFIGDRFLTGLRPQEYYFHCMAGREGLVDTAVKTSRSGYLQRCLVKNLEALRVHYDGTVRDNCDSSIVQFAYGEDGLDVLQVGYLKQYAFLARNAERFAQQLGLDAAKAAGLASGATGAEVDVASLLGKRAKYLAKAAAAKASGDKEGQADANARLAKLNGSAPVSAAFPPSLLGATSEAFADALTAYASANPDHALLPSTSTSEAADGGKKSKKKKKQEDALALRSALRGAVDGSTFMSLMQLKFMRSLAAAGEAVGVLAAQSVGEPSTQMTLNTFHMAGRGEANVTLGIPRLREILMTAAPRIKTPVMTLPIVAGRGLQGAQLLANKMRKLRLAECLSGIRVEERPVVVAAGGYVRTYTVTLNFFKPEQYPAEAELTFQALVDCFEGAFSARLKLEVERESRKRSGVSIGRVEVSTLQGDEAAATGAVAGAEGSEDGMKAKGSKKKGEKADEAEDDDDDVDATGGQGGEGAKATWRGGRGEEATYEGPDDDDEAAVLAALKSRKKAAAAAAARAEGGNGDDGEDDDDLDIGMDGIDGSPSALEREADVLPEMPASPAHDDDDTDALGSGARLKGKKGGKLSKAEAAQQAVLAAAAAAGGLSEEGCVDLANHSCSLALSMGLGAPKLLMLELVERAAAATMVRSTPGIDKVYVIEGQGGEGPKVQTDGVNFEGAWALADLADVTRITTNEVHSVLVTYGVEAARATIMHEVQGVFNAYGIGVDPRHLSLIADFMTHQGGYRACNRIGIESSVSPFLKMSFETAAHFLTDATLRGSIDDLKSPASRLCVGRVVEVGTGAIELVQNMQNAGDVPASSRLGKGNGLSIEGVGSLAVQAAAALLSAGQLKQQRM